MHGGALILEKRAFRYEKRRSGPKAIPLLILILLLLPRPEGGIKIRIRIMSRSKNGDPTWETPLFPLPP